jgi:uncharacterized phage-associated protein
MSSTNLPQPQPLTKAFAVANWFLDVAKRDSAKLNLSRLQQFVFLAYGWYYSTRGEALFDDSFILTCNGPAVISLELHFEHYGKRPIQARYLLNKFSIKFK